MEIVLYLPENFDKVIKNNNYLSGLFCQLTVTFQFKCSVSNFNYM